MYENPLVRGFRPRLNLSINASFARGLDINLATLIRRAKMPVDIMLRPSRHRSPLLLAIALVLLAAVAGFSIARIRALAPPGTVAAIPGAEVAQDDQESEEDEVSPSQLEKYVKVYQAMQADRSITVDQATAREHLTVAEFRDIEGKIERDGVLRERVRRELLKTAQQKSNALKLKPQSAP